MNGLLEILFNSKFNVIFSDAYRLAGVGRQIKKPCVGRALGLSFDHCKNKTFSGVNSRACPVAANPLPRSSDKF